MASIAKLVVSLGANIAEFETDMKRASRVSKKRLREIEIAATDMGRKMAVAAVAASAALTAVIVKTAKTADETQKMALRLGTSVEALSELSHVAELSGVQFNQLTIGMQRMERRIAEVAALGKGEAKQALDQLGLSAEKLAKLPVDQQFEAVAEQLSKVENQSERVRLAFKLFDSEGVALVQTMGQGAEGIRRMRQEARELGKVISTDTANAAVKFNDDITRLRAQLEGVGIQIASRIIPTMSEWVAKLVESGTAMKAAEQIGRVLETGFNALATVIETLTNHSTLAVAALSGFAALKFIPAILVTANPLLAAAAVGGAALAGAFVKIEKDAQSAERALSAIQGTLVDTNEAWLKTAEISDIITKQNKLRAEWIRLDAEITKAEGKLLVAQQALGLGTSFTAKGVADLEAQIEQMEATQAEATKRSVELTKRLDELKKGASSAAPEFTALGKNTEKATVKIEKQAFRLKQLNRLWEDTEEILDDLIATQKEYEDTLAAIEDRYDPIARLVREFEREQQALNRAFREGKLTVEAYQNRVNFLTNELGKAAAATIDVKKETDVWAEAMLEAVRILERSFTSAWENILDGAGNMFDNILSGFKTLLASMLHQLITSPLIKHLEELFKDGGPGLAGFDFGKLGQTLAGLGGVGLGSLLGGGGTGAGIGSALGTLLGTALTASAGPFGQIAGKIIGGILGGLFGGLFDDDPDFELQLVGSNVLGSAALGGRTGPTIGTALGGFAVTNTGDFESADIEKFVAGVRDFDNAFAQFLDAGQLERVTELLKDWGIELDGAAATLENFIGSRLDQIQFALDGAVRAWVESAESLEEEIARTGVAFLTESLFSQRPELFTDRTQQEFLAVVEAFQNGTESITDAFAEVVQIIDAIVSATNALEDFSASDLVADYERFVRLQNETPLESLTRQYIEFSDAVANFDGSPAQLSDIASRVISIRQAEIAALQQIDAIQKGINSNLDRLRQDVLNVFEGPKTGRQLFVEAAGLVDLVAQAETPEEIARLAEQFDAVIRQFSQEDMQRIGDTLVNLIDRFQQASNDSLDRVRQSTIDSAQSMRDIADAFLTTIPDTLALIAASNEDAAAALTAIAGGEINTSEFDPTADVTFDIADTINEGLNEQANVLREGTNMMSDALRDGASGLASNIAAAIQSGFSRANVRVTVVVADDGRITQ